MEENKMDAWRELEKRMPELAVATLDELKEVSIFSKAAAEWGMIKFKAAKDLGIMGAQSEQWLKDSQNAMRTHIYSEKERGKRAKAELKAQGKQIRSGTRAAGSTSSEEKPKWKRMGFKSIEEMATAEFLDSHPEEIEEVIVEAIEEDDAPSKGAVKSKVRAKKAEIIAAQLRDEKIKQPKSTLQEHLDKCINMQSEINVILASIVQNKDQVKEQSMYELARLIRRAAELLKNYTKQEKQKWQKLLED